MCDASAHMTGERFRLSVQCVESISFIAGC